MAVGGDAEVEKREVVQSVLSKGVGTVAWALNESVGSWSDKIISSEQPRQK
jgi:hypothetical protein